MEKRYKKSDYSEKRAVKTEYNERRTAKKEYSEKRVDRADRSMKDRGDVDRYVPDRPRRVKQRQYDETAYPERGDSQFQIGFKCSRKVSNIRGADETKENNIKKEAISNEKKLRRNMLRIASPVSYLAKVNDITERRKLHDLYTFKRNIPIINSRLAETGKKHNTAQSFIDSVGNTNRNTDHVGININRNTDHVGGNINRNTVSVGGNNRNTENVGSNTADLNRHVAERWDADRKAEFDSKHVNQKNHHLAGDAKHNQPPGIGGGPERSKRGPNAGDAPTLKKPLVRTVTTKGGAAKTYKAITFAEQKKPTHLNISLPTLKLARVVNEPHTAATNRVDTATITSVQSNKPPHCRQKRSPKPKSPRQRSPKHKKKRHSVSEQKVLPEVATWDPICLSQDTKPYYEAWVDTKPTALTLHSDSERERLMGDKEACDADSEREDWRKMLSPTPSPSSVSVNYERYAGKICLTVNRKKRGSGGTVES